MTKVIYKDYALINKALEMTVTGDDAEFYATPDTLKTDPEMPIYGTFEKDFLDVDGEYAFCESGDPVGVISRMCGLVNFEFTHPIDLPGLTLKFSDFPDIYPKETIKIGIVSNGILTLGDYNVTSNVPVLKFESIKQNVSRVEIWLYPHVAVSGQQTDGKFRRLQRIDFGIAREYSGDALYSASVQEISKLTAQEVEINTSIVELKGDLTDFAAMREYDIYHNDDYICTHNVYSVTAKKDRCIIEGNSLLKKLERDYIDSSYVNLRFEDANPQKTVKTWIEEIVSNSLTPGNMIDIIFPSQNDDPTTHYTYLRYPRGVFKERISVKNALQYICFAAGLTIQQTRTRGIKIVAVHALLNQTDDENKAVEEAHVFSGDSTEYGTLYKYLKIDTSDANVNGETTGSGSRTNPDASNTTATVEFKVPVYCNYDAVIDVYKDYYFRPNRYRCKAVLKSGENQQSQQRCLDRFNIDGVSVIPEEMRLNLDGDKRIATIKGVVM